MEKGKVLPLLILPVIWEVTMWPVRKLLDIHPHLQPESEFVLSQ